ncbi:hypothetical protein SAMN00777080_2821 [Aquiflexum balticum DSM 16537]|uniref:Uncharacterized protein n=1 Tax=Aquiflexum balticum DSM 16537 TaxID=758820 RepID=A0A1W2H5K6_9BACT|nr:hypothetical protein [Aquiflexum balticum]SMD44203.1 hypothetical protein SAMN00777080_2821 [Aquiflexum balticum DSM 16537]
MAAYTLSKCILENINAGKKYITDLLFVFTRDSNPHKVTVDSQNIILDIYTQLAKSNEFIATWLQLMSHQPSNFEPINVDLSSVSNDEEIFLKVCCETKSQQKIIVFTHEGWKYYNYHSDKVIHYNNKFIYVLDRDEAIQDLNFVNSANITAFGSIIAANQSSINNSDNKQND